jgi:hypothetical protein
MHSLRHLSRYSLQETLIIIIIIMILPWTYDNFPLIKACSMLQHACVQFYILYGDWGSVVITCGNTLYCLYDHKMQSVYMHACVLKIK